MVSDPPRQTRTSGEATVVSHTRSPSAEPDAYAMRPSEADRVGERPESTPSSLVGISTRPSEADLLIAHYNQDREGIRMRHTVKEFTIANMQAMGKNQSLEPEYRIVGQSEQGEYWLIDQHWAVPRPKQTYNIGQFKSGGLGRVFECRGVRQGYRYRRVELIRPARFRNHDFGGLELVERGALEFSDEESEI